MEVGSTSPKSRNRKEDDSAPDRVQQDIAEGINMENRKSLVKEHYLSLPS